MNQEIKLLSIGESAKSIGITRRMILNYEEKGLICPDQKVSRTGNRYYNSDAIARIRSIRALQEIGLSLDEIHDYYDDTADLTPVLERMIALRDKLNMNIEKLQERMKPSHPEDIEIITLPSQTVYRCLLSAEDVEEKKEVMRKVFLEVIRQYGSDTSKRMFFNETIAGDPSHFFYAIAVPEGSTGEHIQKLPETEALCLYHHGAYEELPVAHRTLLTYAREHDIPVSDSFRHIYFEGPPQHKDPAKFITQVVLPVLRFL